MDDLTLGLIYAIKHSKKSAKESIVDQHTSKRGIVTEIRGYLTFEEYWRHKDEGELQRCNGFYFVLKRVLSSKGV